MKRASTGPEDSRLQAHDLLSNVPLKLTSVRYGVAPLRGALLETLAA